MDRGHGVFDPISDLKAQQLQEEGYPLGIFKVGEIVTLKGSRFRVKSIKLKELRLKLLPKE